MPKIRKWFTIYLRSKQARNHIVLSAIVVSFVFLSFFSAWGVHIAGISTERNSITYDEVAHIGSGYHYVHDKTYYLNPEHPPLVKFIAGLPLELMNVTPPDFSIDAYQPEPAQWSYGNVLLFEKNTLKTDKLIGAARLAVTFFNAALLVLIIIMLVLLASYRTAILGASLLVFNPVILGHASLVTFDVPAGFTSLLSLLTFVYYLKKPSIRKAILIGLSLALALLVKFSTAFLLPVFALALFIWLIVKHHSLKIWKRTVAHALIAGGVMLTVMTLFMMILTTRTDTELMRQQFANNWPGHLSHGRHYITSALLQLGIFGKGFAAWVNGFFIVQSVVDTGKAGTVFLGTFYGMTGPGPLYYPLLFVTKMPPTIVFFLCAMPIIQLIQILKRKINSKKLMQSPYLVLLIFLLAYFILATKAPFKIGMRHFMPFIATLAGLSAFAYARYEKGKSIQPSTSITVTMVIGLAVFNTLLAFPYYISYYNFLGGGTMSGYKIATDSNYDWGQDLSRLQAWSEQNSISLLYTDLFVNPFGVQNHYLRNVKTETVNSIDAYDELSQDSYVAVSATNLEQRQAVTGKSYTDVYGEPFARIGTTIFIYKK